MKLYPKLFDVELVKSFSDEKIYLFYVNDKMINVDRHKLKQYENLNYIDKLDEYYSEAFKCAQLLEKPEITSEHDFNKIAKILRYNIYREKLSSSHRYYHFKYDLYAKHKYSTAVQKLKNKFEFINGKELELFESFLKSINNE